MRFIFFFPQKYLNQLKSPENAGLVDTQTVDEIFFMVPAILNIHERFLEELRRRLDAWDPMQKIGDAFVDVVGCSMRQRKAVKLKLVYFSVLEAGHSGYVYVVR